MKTPSLIALIAAAVVLAGGGAYAAGRVTASNVAAPPAHVFDPASVVTSFQTKAPIPTLRAPAEPAKIKVSGASALFGWAFYDRRTDETVGSANDTTVRNTTESMIKPFIAGDYLRLLAARGQEPTKTALGELTLMLIDSNDNMAQKYFVIDGRDAVMKRFVSICDLPGVTWQFNRWAYTNITPDESIRYARCIADGRVAGPKWTAWLLATMKKPRGGVKDQISTSIEGGHWGVIDGLPAALKTTISWKNGWTYQPDGYWHINCMAISPDWMLVVEMHTSGLQKGADICASVTRQLVVYE
jgi:hypothetical protein